MLAAAYATSIAHAHGKHEARTALLALIESIPVWLASTATGLLVPGVRVPFLVFSLAVLRCSSRGLHRV